MGPTGCQPPGDERGWTPVYGPASATEPALGERELPVHGLITRASRACGRRIASRRAAPRGTTWSGRPCTTRDVGVAHAVYEQVRDFVR
ncbi:hypothetical protein ACFYZ2_28835 [Streptomyces sviceus]|uniref:hypothetical protein n=1 Tax=Streptomyces sviceus TaxID=285530 RepID=UPI003679D966